MDRCVYIHTNERQWLGALVAEYALRRNSRHPERFDVRFIHTRDHPFLAAREGQEFLRGGTTRVWRMADLQSFTVNGLRPTAALGCRERVRAVVQSGQRLQGMDGAGL